MDSKQFDASIGGHIEVPDLENTFQYAEGRLPELARLISTVRQPTKNKLIFQSIPRHMRRRTAAQNPKRLPVRFRQGHMSQLRKSGTPVEKKRPSRKYRRRPGNLRKEYARRKRDVTWLETHTWHAKRFHMTKMWGYRIPLTPCDKSYRACYRATKSHCLIQDISYQSTLELRGTLEDLGKLKNLCNPNELSCIARCFVSGQREGNVDIFRCNEYPFGAIGRISFMWKPQEGEQHCLWMFAHPAYAPEIKEQLKELFGLQKTPPMELDDQEIPQNRPMYINAAGSVVMMDLSQEINRFRLTGPLSQAVLHQALKCKENIQISSKDFSQEAHVCQMKYWNDIGGVSPATLPPSMILGLFVEDPRLHRPQKRTKALLVGPTITTTKIPDLVSRTPLWDEILRGSLMGNVMNTQKYAEKRHKESLVPGQRCKFEDELQAVPVLLIQRPGVQEKNKPLGFACGWDIILPACYGTIMWVSLIMWGARAGGWKETVSTLREMGRDTFAPDTKAGKTAAEALEEELRESFFHKPPKKRPNYTKLSVASPFTCPWDQLTQELSADTPFYVLRDKQVLQQCQRAIKYQEDAKKITLFDTTLIPIHILMTKRGNPGNFAILAIPTHQDIAKKQSGSTEPIHLEPHTKDPHEKKRKNLRKLHQKFLKQQRRLRVRRKRKQQEKSEQRVKIPRERSQLVVTACNTYKEKMRKLWLPEASSIRDQCTRKVIGYVTQSDFSFTDATVSAIGYVTWSGFRELIESCRKWKQVMILVRGTKTRQYRAGIVSVRQQ